MCDTSSSCSVFQHEAVPSGEKAGDFGKTKEKEKEKKESCPRVFYFTVLPFMSLNRFIRTVTALIKNNAVWMREFINLSLSN